MSQTCQICQTAWGRAWAPALGCPGALVPTRGPDPPHLVGRRGIWLLLQDGGSRTSWLLSPRKWKWLMSQDRVARSNGRCSRWLRANPPPFLTLKSQSGKGRGQPTRPVKFLRLVNLRFQLTSDVQRLFHLEGKICKPWPQKASEITQRRENIWKGGSNHQSSGRENGSPPVCPAVLEMSCVPLRTCHPWGPLPLRQPDDLAD